MEKPKRWQFYLIIAVIILTLYNILPTIFFYSKPLKQPIDEPRAKEISLEIVNRVDSLKEDSIAWLHSFSNLLKVHPSSVALIENDPNLIQVTFPSSQEADVFKRFFPRAGALIPFNPAQLALRPDISGVPSKTVIVERQVGTNLDGKEAGQIFQFASKRDDNRQITELYRDQVNSRVAQLALGFAGPSKNARQVAGVVQYNNDPQYDDLVIAIAKEIVDVNTHLGKNSPLAKRYFASFSQIDQTDSNSLMQKFIARIETLKKKLDSQREALLNEQNKLKDESLLLDSSKSQLLTLNENQRKTLDAASAILRENVADFKSGQKPLTMQEIMARLAASASAIGPDELQTVDLTGHDPFVQALVIDWVNDTVQLKLYDDVQAIRLKSTSTEAESYSKDKLNQMLINEIARVSQVADESITPNGDGFALTLNKLPNSTGLLILNLGYLANKQAQEVQEEISGLWAPKHSDLLSENYPIRNYDAYLKSSPEDQKLGLVVYAPALYKSAPPSGFRTSSIYVIARGLDSILQKYRDVQPNESAQVLVDDFNGLQAILQREGFIGYPGSSYGVAPEFAKDYIFELNDYYGHLLQATREDFTVKGDKRDAVLEFTDVEQRILTRNKIDDRIQEDLLRWREEYHSAQVDLNMTSKYTVPKPTKNVYWENLKLSFLKYFRGDDRKILKWGLDLSGGKTVRIGLLDQNGRPVTNPEDLHQAVNELYTRINKMGVSERTIRVENNNIVLDFPGSQSLTAAELIRASAMYFHVANEKFSLTNPALADTVNHFLQEVWNEAVVTNRKDMDSLNEIAWQHMGGNTAEGDNMRPVSEYARILYDNGLRLADPKKRSVNSAFNDTLSSIAMYRGDDNSLWYGQSHPLLIVFHNYALEGASLENIQVGYDPSEGNILSFGVKRSYEGNRPGNPRDDFYTWTSQFSEEKIVGTPKEAYSKGHGWRMAVILNGTVISAPTLRAALSNQATISGHFSQREINQLAADLKAGSLSFSPRILSEQNVSPELGKEERNKGILAAVTALCLVIAAMVGYYRFAGLVASCAVILNLLIIWGVLQNLDAALTLPGIAAMVLTIAMAVDANVLVFERVREEFKISGRIGSALQAGYRKAFSAIIDSNITTIIAALVLVQFDSGPIRGFAITLIIGIISSMFTALFVTRYFFSRWVQNPKNKELNMSHFIGNTSFDFLKQAKKAIYIGLILMVVGGYFLVQQRNTIFGMDFTGGYSLTLEVEENHQMANYRLAAMEAFQAQGAPRSDFEVRELSHPNQLRLQFGMGMEEKGHPFYQMPEHIEGKFAQGYQSNPRINWVVNALEKAGLKISETQLENIENNWTVMSGQFSDVMRKNALIGLSIALLCILIYISFRFEFKFGVGAVVGLAFDVLLTLGVLAILHAIGIAVQIDLQVVGAIMTIVGYSLNDTIIVFDRIREDIKVLRKLKFHEIVNHALNVTLSRTLITSGTTLLVLLSLVILGGSTIFAFSLVMTIGVIIGTLSSLFIASPIMLYLHDREEGQQNNAPSKWNGARPKAERAIAE